MRRGRRWLRLPRLIPGSAGGEERLQVGGGGGVVVVVEG